MLFALNAGIALDASAQANYRTLWIPGFADVEPDRLQAAFIACLRSHTFKTMPTIADVRQHLSKAEENAAQREAEQKWTQVLNHAVRLSPDYPDKNPPRISDRTMTAIRAAGGLDYIRDCDQEPLQWARKHFIEAYIRYGELEQDKYLLPAGRVRDLVGACAEQKRLPGEDAYRAARANGESYRERLSWNSREVRRLHVAANKPARLWSSEEERKQAFASLGQRETDPVILERICSQKAALAARSSGGAAT